MLDDKGISRFALLQDALSGGAGNRLVFYAFDLLHLDGWDLAKVPLDSRKALLSQLFAGHVSGRSAIQLSDHVMGDGQFALRPGIGDGAGRDNLEARFGGPTRAAARKPGPRPRL